MTAGARFCLHMAGLLVLKASRLLVLGKNMAQARYTIQSIATTLLLCPENQCCTYR